jgi:hypothetical protein
LAGHRSKGATAHHPAATHNSNLESGPCQQPSNTGYWVR